MQSSTLGVRVVCDALNYLCAGPSALVLGFWRPWLFLFRGTGESGLAGAARSNLAYVPTRRFNYDMMRRQGLARLIITGGLDHCVLHARSMHNYFVRRVLLRELHRSYPPCGMSVRNGVETHVCRSFFWIWRKTCRDTASFVRPVRSASRGYAHRSYAMLPQRSPARRNGASKVHN